MISHECIYQHIWTNTLRGRMLYENLRQCHKKRKTKQPPAKAGGLDLCNGQVKQDTLLSRFLIEFPFIFERGLIAYF